MSPRRIAVVVGSLRAGSYNRRLADALARLGPPEFAFRPVAIGDLPLYRQELDTSPPPPVQRLKDDIRAADGVMFVTPEYNRSIPGLLKNALDLGSRPPAENVWSGKPAGVIGVSIGAIGTACAQQHLRTILAYLDMPTMGQPEAYLQMSDELIDLGGDIGPGSRDFLQGWMDTFVGWVQRHAEPAP